MAYSMEQLLHILRIYPKNYKFLIKNKLSKIVLQYYAKNFLRIYNEKDISTTQNA